MKYALCVKLCQHYFTIVIVHKLLVHGHFSESGLHSLPSRSSRCPRMNVQKSLGKLEWSWLQRCPALSKDLSTNTSCTLFNVEVRHKCCLHNSGSTPAARFSAIKTHISSLVFTRQRQSYIPILSTINTDYLLWHVDQPIQDFLKTFCIKVA